MRCSITIDNEKAKNFGINTIEECETFCIEAVTARIFQQQFKPVEKITPEGETKCLAYPTPL